MRTFAAAALLLACAGCASTPVNQSNATTAVSEVRRIGAEEALGLTRGELEARLRIPAIDRRTISSVELEDGALVETVGAADLVNKQHCSAGGHLQVSWQRGENTWPMPSLIVRDGVVAGFAPAPRRGEDVSLPAYLAVACISKVSRGFSNEDGAWLLAAPVLVPALLAMAAISASDRASGPPRIADRVPPKRDINPSLDKLALGKPPPGGVESYLSNLPPSGQLASETGDETVINFYTILPDENHGRLPRAIVTFRHGTVVRFQGAGCVLTRARSYHCD